MKVFGIQLESTVRVLPYSEHDDFVYQETFRIPQDADGRISLSVLINLKQTDLAPGKKIQVRYAHILDSRDTSPQTFFEMTIKTIPLDDDLDKIATDIPYAFRSDPWEYRQTIRWSLSNLPTQGPGHYAIALLIIDDKDSKKRTFLDCAYFDVV